MSRERTLAEITRDAIQILNRELGPIETLRFLRQYTEGVGNYTAERHEWLDALSLDDIDKALRRDEHSDTTRKTS